MIGHSLPEYIFIRTSIFFLRLIAPLSLTYLCASWYSGSWHYSKWLGYYALVEATFYLGVYLPRSYLLQQPATHPTRLTRAEREALFAKCFATARDTESATGWFHFAPSPDIRRDNLVDWLLWALFSTTTADALVHEWEDELDGYIETIEKLLGRKLEAGRTDGLECMKVTLDPVVSLHRPFLWYLIVAAVDSYTATILSSIGFKHYTQRYWYHHFPPRLSSYFSTPSPHPSISYWYRPHLSTTKNPILFLHGIGIGLWPYTPFLSELITSDPDVGFILVENLPISTRISPPPLTRPETLSALAAILAFHPDFSSYVVIGHSYGTVTAAHILRSSSSSSPSSSSSSTTTPDFTPHPSAYILIDPIPFLLHHPTIAYNFIYRPPYTAPSWQLYYFASRDPDIARVLARHFFWAENVLWREELEGERVGVVLAGCDQVVGAESVRGYLTGVEVGRGLWVGEVGADGSGHNADDSGHAEVVEGVDVVGEADGGGADVVEGRKDRGRLEVLWCPQLDHAQIFDDRVSRRRLLEMVERFIVREG